MKSRPVLPQLYIIIVIVCIVTAISGCSESGDNQNGELNATSEEESRQAAEAYVKNLDSYRTYNLSEPVLLETLNLSEPYSWQFVYEFDLVSEKDPDVIDTATVTVTVIEGKVEETTYAQGSRYKLGIPTGSIGADSLLQKPIYDKEIFVYGTVSELERVPAVSFKLNWEGDVLQVEMAEPAAGIKGIENGDWVIVTGELKNGSESESGSGNGSGSENSQEPVLIAKLVQTEDISEGEIFTSEVVKMDEEGMVIREIPGNATAQTYRVRYEIREDNRTREAAEELFENISPEKPIEIRVDDVKPGSTYTIRVLIRNMEGRILYDAEHVGGFGVENKQSE
ncbi:hypothetical protein FTO70_08895 [Methanosarcina sp. KYL-1]|uniref:hypothetical protein n=1 Tax=Methanosarcina sp. KYL-1 TaxID=2602068 RepID=UPI002100725B|nr:hypothetical protein [Methanosarcina sp. KYL-1]MCQ1535791.1 hypothetical protein [Methanosarcina sp. KYL-1]